MTNAYQNNGPSTLYNFLKLYQIGPINVRQLSQDISRLCRDHAQRIQILILHFNTLNGGYEYIPYNGMLVTEDRGVRYGDLNAFPQELIKIIATYIGMAKKLNV